MNDSSEPVPDLADLPAGATDLLVMWVSKWLGQAERIDVPAELIPLRGFRPGSRHRDARVRAAIERSLQRTRRLATTLDEWVAGDKGPEFSGEDEELIRIARAWLAGDSEQLQGLLASRAEAASEPVVDPQVVAALEQQVSALRSELAAVREHAKKKAAAAREKLARQAGELQEARAQTTRLSAAVAKLEDGLATLREELAASERKNVEQETRNRAEVRSLQAELDRTRRENSQARRSRRYVEKLETARVQVLLRAAQAALAGLGHEIDVDSDTTPAELVRSPETPRNPLVRRPGSSQLREWLQVPGLHLIVDGYNVSKDATPELPLAQQRELLIGRLCALSARTGAEVTLVFDAQNVELTLPAASRRGVRVIFTDKGEIADDLIVDLAAAEPPGRALLVVTSDQELASRVRRHRAEVVSAQEFNRVVGQG